MRPLPENRGTLKLTTARYFLPSGRNLDRSGEVKIWGVDPNPGFVFDLDGQQYTDLFTRRRDYELIVDPDDSPVGNWHDPTWVEQDMQDPQLAAAMRSLLAYIDDGLWHSTGEDPGEEIIRESELADQLAYRSQLLEELERASGRIAELRSSEEALPEGFQFDEAIDLGDGTLELRRADGSVIARFRAQDAELLGASLRAAGATAITREPEQP